MAQAQAADFRAFAEKLAPELVDTLEREHNREVQALFEEQLQLREELSRTVGLMQTEILPREKMMHELMEAMHKAHEAATQHLHLQITEHVKKGFGDHNVKRQEMLDPLQAMESELGRIATLLSHEVV